MLSSPTRMSTRWTGAWSMKAYSLTARTISEMRRAATATSSASAYSALPDDDPGDHGTDVRAGERPRPCAPARRGPSRRPRAPARDRQPPPRGARPASPSSSSARSLASSGSSGGRCLRASGDLRPELSHERRPLAIDDDLTERAGGTRPAIQAVSQQRRAASCRRGRVVQLVGQPGRERARVRPASRVRAAGPPCSAAVP